MGPLGGFAPGDHLAILEQIWGFGGLSIDGLGQVGGQFSVPASKLPPKSRNHPAPDAVWTHGEPQLTAERRRVFSALPVR